MAQAVLRVEGLPDAPLDAAATFHSQWLPQARTTLQDADTLALIFDPAGHEHRAWRLATVQELAREAAPKRVNAVVGDDEAAIAEMLAYLAAASGVTGQLLAVHGKFSGTR